ncbi:fimbrillin family protein [Bacteroides sp. 519]|uniref:fimbrillin family protein n=1 Tax=Bacteroides sp. 519 TaxID=2302937 RepID=UPI0013D0905E|nr:fimbrillin family protein [Bacteroides sp. 519]NDV59443.1 hypothetical protein [Bacteroides sp. 519]
MKINNSLRNSLLLVAGLWLSATSCQNDNTTITNRVPLNVGTADITRAADTTWDKNDAIGIFTLTPGTNNVTDAQANRKYVAQAGGANASFSPSAENQTAYYPTNGDAVEVLAYYPYNGQQAMDNGQLPVDVSNQSALAAIDLMTSARVEGDNDNPDVALSFEHRLSKMEVSLSAASGTEINWTSATLTLRGTATKATYNLYTQTLSGAQSVADIAVPLRSTATGMQGTAIVLPTAKGASLQLVVVAGGHEYIATPSDEAYFGEGEVTSFRVTLRREVSGPTAAEVSATIRPWGEGHEEDLEAINFIVPTDPTTGAPEVESFTLYKNYGTDTQEAVDYTYNADVQKWDATPAPYYLEDIKEDDTFMAIHTPGNDQADQVTGVKDMLQSQPVNITDGRIVLAFEHLNARLTVKLARGAGMDEYVDLNTATIKLLGHTFEGTPQTLFVEPATIGEINIAIADTNFTIEDAKITLKAGTDNIVTIILKVQSDKAMAAVEATVKPWQTGVEEDLEAINFIVPTDPTTGAPEVENFVLYKNKGTANETSATYTYNSNTQKWDANPAPFYVDDITADDTFMAIHTPEADPITGIADVLETAEPVKLTNGVINLAFIHANSQLVFNLIAGTGFTADLTTAKVALHGFGTTAYTATGNSIFIVEKGTLATTGTYKVVITLEGKTYECDFSAKLAGKELVANTSYIFNVTLNPTAVSVGEVVVSDWLTGDSNSGSTQANNITQGSFSFPKGKPGAGEIVISTGTKGQAGYYETIYVWDGADDTDFVLKTGSQDILWDKLDTSVKHSFTLTFTSDAATPEKDIISQTITDVVWGSKLNFTDLKRKNSLFVVELKAGEGYTDANLTWDKVTLTCNLDNSTGTEFGIAEGKAVVKPQNITTTHQLNLAVGLNNYTLNLNEKFSKFEANKSYTLTVFVHKDKIVVDSVSVEDWEGIAADGDIEY